MRAVILTNCCSSGNQWVNCIGEAVDRNRDAGLVYSNVKSITKSEPLM
jgi:hypothetical protein